MTASAQHSARSSASEGSTTTCRSAPRAKWSGRPSTAPQRLFELFASRPRLLRAIVWRDPVGGVRVAAWQGQDFGDATIGVYGPDVSIAQLIEDLA